MDEERYNAVGKSRIDFITDKLLEIASDLKSIVAVHDNRISTIETFINERKIAINQQQEKIDKQFDSLHEKIEELDNTNREDHQVLTNDIVKMQRYLWLCVGGGSVLLWVILNLSDIIHFVQLFSKIL